MLSLGHSPSLFVSEVLFAVDVVVDVVVDAAVDAAVEAAVDAEEELELVAVGMITPPMVTDVRTAF